MDEVIQRIKDYVRVVNSSLNDDDFLDFVVRDVVDRALVYMNRQQLVYQYEKDLVSYPIDDSNYDYFWGHYELPIPKAIERSLATSVTGVFNSVKRSVENTEGGSIKSINDNGQSITYSEKVTEFLASSDEAIFNNIKEVLDRYKLITVIKGDNIGLSKNNRDFIPY